MNRTSSREVIGRLRRVAVGLVLFAAWSNGLRSVAAAPTEFAVESPVDGRTFRLSEARGRYVALHFLLETECPYCLRHTREYASRAETLPDVLQVFLKPDGPEEFKAWAAALRGGGEKTGLALNLFRDPEAKLAEAYAVPGGYEFHGRTMHYPTLVLIDPAGREVFRYVGKNNTDRFSFARLEEKMKELRAKPVAIEQYNLGPDRVALGGYDPVAYFVDGKPVKGRKELVSNHRGVTYRFSNEDHRDRFQAAPDRYLPTYGGWCATAMARGEKVEIDPTNFKVTQGRLFLFFKAFYANALKDWNKDETNLMHQADAQWRRIAEE